LRSQLLAKGRQHRIPNTRRLFAGPPLAFGAQLSN
jgi:hypothetical protein